MGFFNLYIFQAEGNIELRFFISLHILFIVPEYLALQGSITSLFASYFLHFYIKNIVIQVIPLVYYTFFEKISNPLSRSLVMADLTISILELSR